MTLLAIGGGLLLMVAFFVRESQLARERVLQAARHRTLQTALEDTRNQLRRACEDLYVLQHILAERNVLDDTDLARGRVRLVEAPRRMAQERDAIQRHLGISAPYLVIEDSDRKIH